MSPVLFVVLAIAPALLMLLAALACLSAQVPVGRLWQGLVSLSCLALVGLLAVACGGQHTDLLQPFLRISSLSPASLVAVLVQLLGSVIAAFSARYLAGEPHQRRFIAALAGVLAAVQILLLADHWLVLIAAWALVGIVLRQLLCFYPERPFAQLAAHKKQIADRLADGLLIGAAAFAWFAVGSGSLSALTQHIADSGMSPALQASALLLVLAVILRSALMPVHGWLIQVMEAPTPVSALLHAGVVNLGGFVLIRFAPLLQQAIPARAVLLLFGLTTAVLAGMVMLTRISIKVKLAWSTVAQMGFMLVECSLGLYTLALLHLIGHSLYKAQAFLAASSVVRQTRLAALRGEAASLGASLLYAPLLSVALVLVVHWFSGLAAWPWWWCLVLGFSWAPLLWLPRDRSDFRAAALQHLSGMLMVVGMTAIALLAHRLPLGLHDTPHTGLGLIALAGMTALYACLAVLQRQPRALQTWRRWSYAGFYVDEAFTRLALRIWPARWGQRSTQSFEPTFSAGLATGEY